MLDDIDTIKLNGSQLGLISDTLSELTRTPAGLGYFLSLNGLGSIHDHPAGLPFPQLTFEVVGHARASGTLKPILNRLAELYPESPYLRALPKRLDVLSPIVVADQDPDEALQRMMNGSAFGSPVLLADKLVSTCAKLCLVRAPGQRDAVYGTGFLVGSDLVLTAGHVVAQVSRGQAKPTDIKLTFGLVETAAGLMTVETVDVVAILCSQPHSRSDVSANSAGSPSDRELDFALLRIERPIGASRGFVDVRQATPSQPKFVTILQHPGGRALAQSFGVTVGPGVPHRLRYQASTLKGSSGGLVLDDQLNAVALHHAGDPNGELHPQFNQGVPLSEIAAAMSGCF